MTRLSTLPSTREQARHALLLLGVPTTPRLLVDVHQALFDGDLSIPSVATQIREDERSCPPPAGDGSIPGPDPAPAPGPGPAPGASARPLGAAFLRADVERRRETVRNPYRICPGLNPDLSSAHGVVTLSTWPVTVRIHTPATARAHALAVVVRVAEFVAIHPGACGAALVRRLAEMVPGGVEAIDVLNPLALADVARTALAAPALTDAVAAETPVREAAAARAARLDERLQLFGIPAVPHQRGNA